MKIEEVFKNPPKDYSVLAFWFWNGELEEEKLRWQIDEMTEKGIYGGFLHSRAYLKTPYLEKEWWDAVDVCVDEGKKKGFSPWLYDEYAWPSGTAGSTFEYGFQKPSRTLSEGEINMAKGLYAKTFSPEEKELEKKGNEKEDRLLKTYEKDGYTMAFYCHIFPKAVDYLNRETIARFIEYTHEEYRKRYGEEFGKLIPGIFFDEIHMMGNPIPWTKRLPEVFLETCGYNIMDYLPSLIEGEEEKDRKIRTDYFGVITDMYEDAFFVQISEWCKKNHLMLTGHTEEFLWEHPRCQGDYFKTMRHLAIPGSDNHDYRYRFPRKVTYCEPKYSISVARAYDKSRCMSEAMGGAGWGCSLEEFKRGINTMGAMGTNLFIPHGFYYECEHQGSQSDWPASFFYQNPYWKYFKIFADYIRRICYMNSIGNPVVEYGIFYPLDEMRRNMVDGEENAYGKMISRKFHEALEAMIENQLDTDMIDEESLLKATVETGLCVIGQQHFSVLLFPKGIYLREELSDKLKLFQKNGGILIFYETGYGSLPSALAASCVCEVDDLAKQVEHIGKSDIKVIYGDRTDLFINHRKFEMYDYYFVSNSSAKVKNLILSIRSKGQVYFLNPETGEKKSVSCRSCETGTEIELHLDEDEAGYLIFDNSKKGNSTAVESVAEHSLPVMGAWNFLPLSKEYNNKWGIDASKTILEIPIASFQSDVSNRTEIIRISNMEGQEGKCERHVSLWKGGWITRRPSWNDQLNAGDLYFRKIVNIEGAVCFAEICIAAVSAFQVYINGKVVCEGVSNAEPKIFSINDYLKKGKNLIAIHVHNEKPLNDVYVCSAEELPEDRFISLLFQGEIETNCGHITITSDESWAVNDKVEINWNGMENDVESKMVRSDVLKCKNFNKGLPSGLWIPAWERGKPPLKPWGDKPLFGKNMSYPLNLYYIITIPSGTEAIYEPEISGLVSYTLDGKPIEWTSGQLVLKSSATVHQLGITVTAQNGSDGLKKPIKVKLVPVYTPLMDWRRHGLDWFSGRSMYSNTFNLQKLSGKYEIDLGTVNFYGELWINGYLAGVRIWAPYRLDVTDLVKEGTNDITVIAANSAANERRYKLVDEGMALGWNRYWNEDNIDRESENLVAGLLGPVLLIQRRNI